MRVHELAKELGISSKELIKTCKALKIDAKGHMSALDGEAVRKIKAKSTPAKPKADKKRPKRAKGKTSRPKKKKAQTTEPVTTEKKQQEKKIEPVPPQIETIVFSEKPKDEKRVRKERDEPAEKVKVVEGFQAVEKAKAVAGKILEVEIPISVKQLSVKLGVKPSDIIMYLMKKGILATINQNLEEDVVNEIGANHGFIIKKAKTLEEELITMDDDSSKKGKLIPRSPVVTFMGHVDHGKTSLLDYIRNTKIVAKEKGGITQHIGAYKVDLDKGSVTFLDTPGHEAFTAMRARGASATDIVVLVVAADDGVMPQTKEAIDHARAANVPIVVAINKSDLPHINLDKVKNQLNEQGLIPEDWGGKTIMVPVSAKTGVGIDNLLEMLLLEAEMLELKAKPSIRARGVVIEAKLSPGRGVVSTLLVKNGTLRIGDTILSGMYYGRIKAMIGDRGNRMNEAPPSMPVEVLGLQGVPEAGDEFFVVKDEKKAKTLSMLKLQEKKHRDLQKGQRISLEHLYEQIQKGGIKELKIILKADVQGSVEALQRSLENLSTDEVKLRTVHVGVGNISESDVMLAIVANAIIIGFHVRIDPKADEVAKKEDIDVRRYDVIYEAINDVKAAMEGLLEPIIKATVVGKAKVQQTFKVTKVGNAAGCMVVKGTISRPNKVRLLRQGKEIYTGKIRSLKRFKDDARDVTEGMECGIALEGHNDVKPGDIIESIVFEKIARRLDKKRK